MTAEPLPRVTFGMIVLNGEPFVRYSLRALYPFAHELIVVEGAAPGAACIAAADGHSRDGTLQTLRRFQDEEDPQGKVHIVTAEDEGHADGFWPGEKDEQSRAYARRASGDFLWQVDVDEFYLPHDMRLVLDLLAADSPVTAVTFPMTTFWGSLDVMTDGWYLRRGAGYYHRLFRWGSGYQYAKHRPPTVLDDRGRDTRDVCWLDGPAVARLGVRLYHYSLLFPQLVREKVEYHMRGASFGEWFSDARNWYEQSYATLQRPYRVHNVYREPSWLERFPGVHPPEVERMMGDIAAGSIAAELRPMADAERLLGTWWYPCGRRGLQVCDHVDRARRVVEQRARAALRPVKRTLVRR